MSALGRLLAFPGPAERRRRAADRAESAAALPHTPLPDDLRRRLLAIPEREPAPEMGWLRSVRPAVAASYLLALLTVAALGNPVLWARERLERLGGDLRQRVTPVVAEHRPPSLATLGAAAAASWEAWERTAVTRFDSARQALAIPDPFTATNHRPTRRGASPAADQPENLP